LLARRQTARVVRVRRLRGRERAKAVSIISMHLAEEPAPQHLLVQVLILAKMTDA
jgi:hypothetical protein